MDDSIKDKPQDLEVRFCCVCHKEYKYPNNDGSDLRCCSAVCEEQLLDEEFIHYLTEAQMLNLP